jgi:redox-sensitive bicupin YhaK (pirin superfamily)
MLLEPRTVKLTTRTGIDIRRTLPNARKRTIGAWCFVDHFGPTAQDESMVVAAHPHSGLQTATWLFEGEVEHRDSLGTVQQIRPGQLNLMTAGRGISHSELGLQKATSLHAVQLWIVLPDSARNVAPAFQQVATMPKFSEGSLDVTLFAGQIGTHKSEAVLYSDLLGAELRLATHKKASLPVRTDFEHGILVVSGSARINGEDTPSETIQYFAPGLESLEIETLGDEPLVAILLGGVPFDEEIVMWWNFIERSHDEIVAAREEWNSRGPRFGQFEDQIGGWTPAPELPNLILRPRKD